MKNNSYTNEPRVELVVELKIADLPDSYDDNTLLDLKSTLNHYIAQNDLYKQLEIRIQLVAIAIALGKIEEARVYADHVEETIAVITPDMLAPSIPEEVSVPAEALLKIFQAAVMQYRRRWLS